MESAQREAIRKQAELLAGEDLGEEGDALVELAAQRACAYCQRTDIPHQMEQAVAALVLDLRDGGSVQSVTRGDTAVTYQARNATALLSPFRRLGRVKEETP